MKIYFAGPLFSQAETKFNQALTEKLEKKSFSVFLPQRDGVEKNKPPYDKMREDERRKALFELDRDEILKADVFLFILDGRVPDEGACVELGIAYAQRFLASEKKILVGLATNSWRLKVLNPMIRIPLDYIAENEEDLVNYLVSIKK